MNIINNPDNPRLMDYFTKQIIDIIQDYQNENISITITNYIFMLCNKISPLFVRGILMTSTMLNVKYQTKN